MRSLLDAGVTDEIRMMVCPVARGTGTRVFADRRNLRLVEATGFDNGIAIMRNAIDE